MNSIFLVFRLINKKEKLYFFFLLVINILNNLIELIGISLVIPLLLSILNKNSFLLKKVNIYFDVDAQQLTFFIVFLIILVFSIKFLYSIFSSILINKYLNKIQNRFAQDIFKKYIYQNYHFFLFRSSSEIIRNISSSKSIASLLTNLINFFSEILMIFFLMFLLVLNFSASNFFVLVVFIFIIYFFSKIFKNKIYEYGKKSQNLSAQFYKNINHILGSIKSIKVYRKENIFYNEFNKILNTENKIILKNNFIQSLPRIVIEFLIILSLSFLIFILLLKQLSSEDVIVSLGVLVAICIRMLPSTNRIIMSLQKLRYELHKIRMLEKDNQLEFIDKENYKKIYFIKNLRLENVSYSYKNSGNEVLKSVNLEIKKGDFIGIVGKSGSGKTTLINIILGLIEPTNGKIYLDNKIFDFYNFKWVQNFGYVPQNTYLLDATVLQNVALELDENLIDKNKVIKSLLDVDLEKYALDLNYIVGDAGVRLSGGEQQRFAIARALYNDPDIIFLDEATNSLDQETEKNIFEILKKFKGKKTIIMISHKNSIYNFCDYVYEVKNNFVNIKKYE
jgi:ABC-type bacteriocin/lantibiotic exporter with double-glycine peptidase domain